MDKHIALACVSSDCRKCNIACHTAKASFTHVIQLYMLCLSNTDVICKLSSIEHNGKKKDKKL